ncbi:MAG: alpha/beta fold hydrolase [Litoreibacter sp.]|uniref:alpha/beta fold hydrolase n=1 Tax=Litoreibacter sp. TaxID=1969459 RepID=UPI003299B3DF
MSNYEPFTKISGKADGPALLLLNSLGTTTQMWSPQLAMLEKFYKVIQIDTRGHGQSATPPSPYSFDDLIADAFGVLDRNGVEKVSVMGCSLGSMTALGMGIHSPERIERIVCTAARADSPAPFRQSWDDRVAVIKEKGVAALWDGSLGNWLTPAFKEANPDAVATMKTEFLKTTDDGYHGCAMALKDLDFLKDLGGLDVPILFVAGSEDKGAAPDTMREMDAKAKNSEFTVIPDAGHIVNVNQPKAFSLAIMDFLGMTEAP